MRSPFVNQLKTSPKWRINPRLRLRWINDSIKARQIGAEFFYIFKRMAPFVEADVERLVRRVNSQTETNDQEWCTSEGSPVRAGSKTNSRNAHWQSRLRSHIPQIDDGLFAGFPGI